MVSTVQESTQVLSNYQREAALFCSNAAGVGVIAGAVSLTASIFFDYPWLYSVTVTGCCFCAWAGTKLSQTSSLEVLNQEWIGKILNFLPQSIVLYLGNAHKWVEIRRWPPVSNRHTFLPPDNIFSAIGSILFPRPSEFVEIRALSNGIHLKYETLNLQTKEKSSGYIPLNRPIDEMIEFLRNCFVSLEDDGTPAFSTSYHTLSIIAKDRRFKTFKIKVELLLRKSDLIWNIYDKKRKNVFSQKEIPLSYRCSAFTKSLFTASQKSSLTDQIRFARECVLYKSLRSNEISLEPIHQSSYFQEDILVSKFMWAVTLVRRKKHAKIVIEGINGGYFPKKKVPIGKYFMYLADLLGGTEIGNLRVIKTRIKNKWDIDNNYFMRSRLWYEERSDTWKRTSERVKDMIEEIEKEKADPPKGFAIYGCRSIFASKEVVRHSCITWAIEKLSKIGIILEKKSDSSVFYTDTSDFTKYKPDQTSPEFDTFLFMVSDSKLI